MHDIGACITHHLFDPIVIPKFPIRLISSVGTNCVIDDDEYCLLFSVTPWFPQQGLITCNIDLG